MPKKLLVLIILLLSLSLFTFNAFAQSALEKTQSDYTHQLIKFQETKDKYTIARASYLSFKTATSKQDAFLKSRDYLQSTDDLYIAYLAQVQETANSLYFPDPSKKAQIDKILKEESDFFREDKSKAGQLQTLEQIPGHAKNLKDHIEKTTLQKIYKVYTINDIAQTQTAFESFNQLSQNLDTFAKSKLPKIGFESFFANWNSEIEKIRNTSQTQLKAAQDEFETNKSDTGSEGQYQQITGYTRQANKELKRSKNLFLELLRNL